MHVERYRQIVYVYYQSGRRKQKGMGLNSEGVCKFGGGGSHVNCTPPPPPHRTSPPPPHGHLVTLSLIKQDEHLTLIVVCFTCRLYAGAAAKRKFTFNIAKERKKCAIIAQVSEHAAVITDTSVTGRNDHQCISMRLSIINFML